MADVCGVGRKASGFSDAEMEALRGHEKDSTSAVLNQIRKDAGFTGNVELGGDAESFKAMEAKEKNGLPGGAAVAEGVVEVTAATVAEGALLGGLLEFAGAALGAYEAVHAILHAEKGAAAVERDAVQMAMLANLQLPEGFKREEIGKVAHPTNQGWQSGAQKLGERIKLDPAAHKQFAVVQLHCDQGMQVARRMCDSAIDKDAFLKANADVAKRCSDDPAFKAGFEAVVWAKKDGPASYSTAVRDLESRDCSYQSHHVAVRG